MKQDPRLRLDFCSHSWRAARRLAGYVSVCAVPEDGKTRVASGISLTFLNHEHGMPHVFIGFILQPHSNSCPNPSSRTPRQVLDRLVFRSGSAAVGQAQRSYRRWANSKKSRPRILAGGGGTVRRGSRQPVTPVLWIDRWYPQYTFGQAHQRFSAFCRKKTCSWI